LCLPVPMGDGGFIANGYNLPNSAKGV